MKSFYEKHWDKYLENELRRERLRSLIQLDGGNASAYGRKVGVASMSLHKMLMGEVRATDKALGGESV